jgi:CheY-like chemotaxis protein
MDLLVAYQNELLALMAILVVIYIYIIIKRKASHSSSEKEVEKEKIPDTITTPIKEKAQETEKALKTPLQEATTLLDGKEEGDFGIVEEPKNQNNETAKKRTICKRAVPPHAKIVKDDFKEFSGQRILLAEDNIINQKVIQGLLAESGIEISVANDGVEALDILEKDNNFMMILMDAHMPRMDGFEATQKIRSNPNYDHIIVVALSGDTAADDIRKMNEAGMTEHLEKPLKMDALYDLLYAYIPNDNQNNNSSSYSELDIEEGLEISGNDNSFYHEILNEFIKSYKDAHEKIDSLVKHNNIQNADRLLLDIIGVSANIGATKLNKTAVRLKTSLAGNDNEKSRLLFEFKENLDNLTKEIKRYLQS